MDTWEDNENGLVVVGWAAAPEDVVTTAARDVQLVLSTMWKHRHYPCTPMLRPDVRRSLDLAVNGVGFRVVVPRDQIPPGKLEASLELRIGGKSPHRIALGRTLVGSN